MILEPPNLVKFMFFSHIFSYLKNFMPPAQKVQKFKFWKALFGETPILEPHILLGLVYFSYLPIPKI